MSKPVLEMINVTLELGDETVLHDISLKIYQKDTIVIVGPSGSGKTVLMKTMAGVYPPTKGHVFCYGHEWDKLSVIGKHEMAKKIGMQFQKSALFDYLTAFENVAFPLKEHGYYTEKGSEPKLESHVMEVLEQVNLKEARNLYPHEMSGGMRQRLGIARSIVLKPEILFMDDPTAGLDPLNSDRMVQLILKLKDDIDATLVIITHDVQLAYQMAGRIFLIVDGKIIETGNANETRHHPDPRVQQFIHGRLTGPIQIQ